MGATKSFEFTAKDNKLAKYAKAPVFNHKIHKSTDDIHSMSVAS